MDIEPRFTRPDAEQLDIAPEQPAENHVGAETFAGRIAVEDASTGSEEVPVTTQPATTPEATLASGRPPETDEEVRVRHQASGGQRKAAYDYGPRRPGKPEWRP